MTEIIDGERGWRGPCWCDASPDCWHSLSCLDATCGGSGVLHCECGGDLCVCHNHGETECPGCEDCEPDDDYDYPDYGDY